MNQLEASSDADLWDQLSAKLNIEELQEVARRIFQANTARKNSKVCF